jgi:hypothetical protein
MRGDLRHLRQSFARYFHGAALPRRSPSLDNRSNQQVSSRSATVAARPKSQSECDAKMKRVCIAYKTFEYTVKPYRLIVDEP